MRAAQCSSHRCSLRRWEALMLALLLPSATSCRLWGSAGSLAGAPAGGHVTDGSSSSSRARGARSIRGVCGCEGVEQQQAVQAAAREQIEHITTASGGLYELRLKSGGHRSRQQPVSETPTRRKKRRQHEDAVTQDAQVTTRTQYCLNSPLAVLTPRRIAELAWYCSHQGSCSPLPLPPAGPAAATAALPAAGAAAARVDGAGRAV